MVSLPPLKFQLSKLQSQPDLPNSYISPPSSLAYVPVTPPETEYQRPTYISVQDLSPSLCSHDSQYGFSASPFFEPRLDSSDFGSGRFGGGVSPPLSAASPNLPSVQTPYSNSSIQYTSLKQYYVPAVSVQEQIPPKQYYPLPQTTQVLDMPATAYESPAAQSQTPWYPTDPTRKLYVCNHPSCTKSYTRKYNLLTHQISVHSDSRPYSCKLCNTSFSRPHDLRRHNRSLHSDIRPFKCSHCEMTFARSDALKRHLDRDESRVRKGGNSCDKMRAFRRAAEKADWRNTNQNTNDQKINEESQGSQPTSVLSDGESISSVKRMRITDMLN